MITARGRHPDWGKLHGREVWYTTRNAGQPGKTRTVVDEVTLATEPHPDGAAGSGWLSITGRSIENKASERLFTAAGTPAIPVEDRHHALWHAVLASYRDAAEYNEPGTDRTGRKLERSRHVPLGDDVPARLAEGDLVYLRPAAEPTSPPAAHARASAARRRRRRRSPPSTPSSSAGYPYQRVPGPGPGRLPAPGRRPG